MSLFKSSYSVFNRWLERNFPGGLYQRALIILIAPLIVLQTIMTIVILDQYWDNVSRTLARSLSRQVGMVVETYQQSDKSPATVERLQTTVRERLGISLGVMKSRKLPTQVEPPFLAFFDSKMNRYLRRDTGKNFWVNSDGRNNKIEIQVEVGEGTILRFLSDADNAQATATPWILGLMIGSSLLLMAVAVAFLRKQIKPILDLANAAKDFGTGRQSQGFRPRGASEIREAGQAFLDMRRRIQRHVEQRTAMLAGVSHDLRTILTRFKLQLAMMQDDKRVAPLKADVLEMQHMLEDYIAFVKGDGGEQVENVDLPELISSVVENVQRDESRAKTAIHVGGLPSQPASIKRNSFKRLMLNLVGNAARHARLVEISGETTNSHLWIYVDDDGPGIPEELREQAFKPFVRLDNARNLDHAGTGLGLAIALDIAHAHGGDIALKDSALGGLRVEVRIPV